MAKEKIQKKRGRPQQLTAELIEELFEMYKVYAKSNPYLKKDYVGQKAEEVIREYERPLSIDGFKVFCRKQKKHINEYFNNRTGTYDIFTNIMEDIKVEIRADQIEGAAAGIYSQNVIIRLNKLSETVDQTTTTHVINLAQ